MHHTSLQVAVSIPHTTHTISQEGSMSTNKKRSIRAKAHNEGMINLHNVSWATAYGYVDSSRGQEDAIYWRGYAAGLSDRLLSLR